MPNKKKQRNGFYFFMKELQQNYAAGGRFIKIEKLPTEAHPLWLALPEEKKEVYNAKAKAYKSHAKVTEAGKMDCFGLPISHSQQMQSEQEKKITAMERDIRKLMSQLGSLEAIARHEFYIVAFSNFCKTDDKVYIPAEVGLVEFSIENGIVAQYHKFIDPGEIPKGYTFTCMDESEKTHGIPIKKFELASNNYRSIYNDMIRFVKPSSTKSDTRHVYIRCDDIEATTKSFEWLCEKSRDPEPSVFEVYDLSTLLVELRLFAQNYTDEKVALYTSLANEILTKHTYDYMDNIGCKWHDEQDKSVHCALSVAKRLGFLLADAVCEIYNIELIAGKHLPCIEETSVTLRPDSYHVDGRPTRYEPPSPKRQPPSVSASGAEARPFGRPFLEGGVFGPKKEKVFIAGKTPGVMTEVCDSLKSLHVEPVKHKIDWNAVREPDQGSSAASIVRGQLKDFNLNDEYFPDLGGGGATPKMAKTATHSNTQRSDRGWEKRPATQMPSDENIFTKLQYAGFGRGKPKH